jgi:hypothetical protein
VLVGRERIEKARALRYREPDNIEPLLRLHEYALLRIATSTELETYVVAEEAITVCQLKQRNILKAAGMRGKVWEDEERGEACCIDSLIVRAMNSTGIGLTGMLCKRRLGMRKFLGLMCFTNKSQLLSKRRGTLAKW